MKGYLFPTAKAEAVPYTPLPSLPTSLLRNNQYSHCGHCTNDESLCDPVAMADPSSLPLPATAHGEGARSPQHAAAVIPQHHRASSNSSDGMDAATTVPHASFASRVMAPASEWYEEMRWSRGGAKMSKSMRWVVRSDESACRCCASASARSICLCLLSDLAVAPCSYPPSAHCLVCTRLDIHASHGRPASAHRQCLWFPP